MPNAALVGQGVCAPIADCPALGVIQSILCSCLWQFFEVLCMCVCVCVCVRACVEQY